MFALLLFVLVTIITRKFPSAIKIMDLIGCVAQSHKIVKGLEHLL